jgi:hypothetical protein
MTTLSLPKIQLPRNWLSGSALWLVISSWAACGVWGWSQATSGLIAAIAIALTLGAQVFAARAVKNAAQADSFLRRCALLALGSACLAFSGWAGHQGLTISENQRWATYDAATEAKASNARIDAQIAALPQVPLSDEAGRPIGPARTRELGAQRSNEIARLSGYKVPVVEAATPAPRMPDGFMWALTGLIAALELFGFFSIGSKPREAVVRSAASEMARKRWNLA